MTSVSVIEAGLQIHFNILKIIITLWIVKLSLISFFHCLLLDFYFQLRLYIHTLYRVKYFCKVCYQKWRKRFLWLLAAAHAQLSFFCSQEQKFLFDIYLKISRKYACIIISIDFPLQRMRIYFSFLCFYIHIYSSQIAFAWICFVTLS